MSLGMAKTKEIKCPHMGCDGVGIPVDTRKKFSLGKAAVGGVIGGTLLGAPGALIGGMTGLNGKNGKTRFVCSKCGEVFEKKV